jgi:hypothetical protein
MRIALTFAALSLTLAAPSFASADSFNSLNWEVSTGSNDLGWMYGPNDRESSAKVVLAKLRALCGSDHHYDQYYCARGMKVLNKAYAEYKLRMAAQNSVAQ